MPSTLMSLFISLKAFRMDFHCYRILVTILSIRSLVVNSFLALSITVDLTFNFSLLASYYGFLTESWRKKKPSDW